MREKSKTTLFTLGARWLTFDKVVAVDRRTDGVHDEPKEVRLVGDVLDQVHVLETVLDHLGALARQCRARFAVDVKNQACVRVSTLWQSARQMVPCRTGW